MYAVCCAFWQFDDTCEQLLGEVLLEAVTEEVTVQLPVLQVSETS